MSFEIVPILGKIFNGRNWNCFSKTSLNIVPVLPYNRNKIGVIFKKVPKNSRFHQIYIILESGFQNGPPNIIFDENDIGGPVLEFGIETNIKHIMHLAYVRVL